MSEVKKGIIPTS